MKKIINNLPIDVTVYFRTKEHYSISNYGFCRFNQSVNDVYAYQRRDRRQPPFFATINDNVLEISEILVKETDETIEFYHEKVAELIYNKDFNELEQNILLPEYNDDDSIFFVVNSCILDRFFGSIIQNESFYETLITRENVKTTPLTLRNLYLYKYNKYLQLLIDNDMWPQIKELLDSSYSNNPDDTNTTINLNIITLVKNMSGSMLLPICANLVEKYNYTELMKLATIAQHFNFSTARIWEVIADIENVSITEIGNFLIKSIFVSGKNIVLSSSDRLESRVYDFISMYKDYINIRDEGEDLFPENLRVAHDSALERIKESQELELRKKKEQEYAKLRKTFKENVSKYSDLSWKYEDYNVVIPEKPEDLEEEGHLQHNCVAGYVKNVTKGVSKICFLKKQDKPYITIEIRRDEIVQAKRAFNEGVSEADLKVLNLWATEKNLTIITL